MTPSCTQIIALVAREFGVAPQDITSADQTRRVAEPRQVAMYLCRTHTTASLRLIARVFQRSNSGVHRSVEVVRDRLSAPLYRATVEQLEQQLHAFSAPPRQPFPTLKETARVH